MSTKIKFWQWPNILAIDASLIAVVWLWVFAREQSADLSLASYAVLAMSVWLTYISDRLFDAGPRHKDDLLSDRHKFAKRRARPLSVIWAVVLPVNLLIAISELDTEQLLKGFALLAVCLAYTISNHHLSKKFFPKELFVALIFTGGIQVFLPQHMAWPSLISFALICLTNCLCIGWKEAKVDNALNSKSLSSISDMRLFYPLMLTAVGFSALSSGYSAFLPCILFLLIIHIRRRHYHTESFRVLCDALLLFGPMVCFFGSLPPAQLLEALL